MQDPGPFLGVGPIKGALWDRLGAGERQDFPERGRQEALERSKPDDSCEGDLGVGTHSSDPAPPRVVPAGASPGSGWLHHRHRERLARPQATTSRRAPASAARRLPVDRRRSRAATKRGRPGRPDLAAVLATCHQPRRRGRESEEVALERGRLDAALAEGGGAAVPGGGPGRRRDPPTLGRRGQPAGDSAGAQPAHRCGRADLT